jgi:precorrin-6B methylase 1
MWHLSGVDVARRIEIDKTSRTESVVGTQNRHQRCAVISRGDDGLIDSVSRVVRKFDQQKQLRKCVVLDHNAFRDPPLGDREEVRE